MGKPCPDCGQKVFHYTGCRRLAGAGKVRPDPEAVAIEEAISFVGAFDTPTESDPRRRYTLAQMETALRHLAAKLTQPGEAA